MTRLPGAAVLVVVAAAACSKPAVEPLHIERGMITVNNQTADRWSSVEIWINRTYRVTAATIEPGSRFQVPAGSFVSGYGQRFDFDRMQLKDVRLTATTPEGQPVEHIMAFRQGGLEGAFGGRQ
jgi:hypothetical protein